MTKYKIENNIKELLDYLGVPFTASTKDTPKRVVKMYEELFSGLRTKPPRIKVFHEGTPSEYVCVSNINCNSVCEHHMLPFFGKCGVVYVTNAKGSVIGLSKIPRIVEYWSKRPQLQERLTNQIATDLMNRLKPFGVYVVMTAVHSCVTLRGIKAIDSFTSTASMLGDIDKDEAIKLLTVNNFFK